MLDIPMLLIKSAKSHHHQQMVTNSSCLQHLMFTVTTMKIAAQEVTFWGWQWRVTKINLVFVNHKHMKWYMFVMHKFVIPKLMLRAGTNEVCDSISGGGSRGAAHSSPTNQKPSIAPIFVHSSAGARHPKEKPAGGGWGLLNKRQTQVQGAGAKWGDNALRGSDGHIERQRRLDERWCYKQPGQIRGRHNERQHNNQMAHQKTLAPQEVAAQQEATWQPTGWMGGNVTSRGDNTSRGRKQRNYRQHNNQLGQMRGISA
jgi:hypothetical protein